MTLKFRRLALLILASACTAVFAGQHGYKVSKMYSLMSFDKIEYFTRDQLLAPDKEKVEKGKLDANEYKIKESMTPKGGVLAANITTQKKFLGEADPVVAIKIMKDSAGPAIETCDADNQKPGLAMGYASSFTGSYKAQEDENSPTMIFECGFKKQLPDTFYIDLVTFDGKSKSKYKLFGEK